MHNNAPTDKQHIAGLLLAGGRARRLGGIDKGLLRWRGLPLAEHVLRRISPQVGAFSISCNSNLETYQSLAQKYQRPWQDAHLPALLEDSALPGFAGPLAGIFSMLDALQNAGENGFRWLFVCCCDTPQLPRDLVRELAYYATANQADGAYPVIGDDAMRLSVLLNIEAARSAQSSWLQAGEADHSVRHWLAMMTISEKAYSPRQFGPNVNRPGDFEQLDARLAV